MKNRIKLLLLAFVCMMFIPSIVNAAEKLKTLNLRETLAEEEMEERFTNYKETDDQITIYLFRGNGCGYCRAFLTFLNTITEEYGKYFKLQSYEVWHDEANSAFMQEVSTFLNQPAGGVPYIIIGDKVFGGYASDYDESIKSAIVDLYNTKKSKRYDVIKEMNKFKLNPQNVLIISLCATLLIFIANVIYTNGKIKKLSNTIEELKEPTYKKKQKGK